jgi:hypothetical protein
MWMRQLGRNSHWERVLPEQSQKLHPSHRSSLLRREQDSRSVFHSFAKPSPQRQHLVKKRFTPVPVKTLHSGTRSLHARNRYGRIFQIDVCQFQRSRFLTPQRMAKR